jgi:hypothetical protein
MQVAEQYAGSHGQHIRDYMFGGGFGEANAANYSAMMAGGGYLGGAANPMAGGIGSDIVAGGMASVASGQGGIGSDTVASGTMGAVRRAVMASRALHRHLARHRHHHRHHHHLAMHHHRMALHHLASAAYGPGGGGEYGPDDPRNPHRHAPGYAALVRYLGRHREGAQQCQGSGSLDAGEGMDPHQFNPYVSQPWAR